MRNIFKISPNPQKNVNWTWATYHNKDNSESEDHETSDELNRQVDDASKRIEEHLTPIIINDRGVLNYEDYYYDQDYYQYYDDSIFDETKINDTTRTPRTPRHVTHVQLMKRS